MAQNPIDYEGLNDKLRRRLGVYDKEIESLVKDAEKEIADYMKLHGGQLKEGEIFEFAKFPTLKAKADKIYEKLASDINARIVYRQNQEWMNAAKVNDSLVDKILGTTKLPKNLLEKAYSPNIKALEAFQQRKVNGLGLSDRVWNVTKGFEFEMQNAIDMALLEGVSAQELSQRVRHLLNDPDDLFRRVRDARGILHLSKAAKEYHPGSGKYRSAAKNAKRLARTEITMAYRKSEMERWNNLDFIVGYEVHLSQSHVITDICDELKGKYPKTFTFVGWHPQCLCYVTSILATDKEIEEMEEQIIRGEETTPIQSQNSVTEPPKGFTQWVKNNAERSEGWKSQPYFIRDNFVDGKLSKGLKPLVTEKPLPTIKPTTVSSEIIYPENFDETRKALLSDDIQVEMAKERERYGLDASDMRAKHTTEFLEYFGGNEHLDKLAKQTLDDAEVYMAMDGSTIRKILGGDGKIKNSLETGKGTFKTIGDDRAVKERLMFGIADDVTDPDLFPKYGFMSGSEMGHEGIVGWGYGNCFIKFKKGNILNRTTVTFGDSYDGNMVQMINGRLQGLRVAPPTKLAQPDGYFFRPLGGGHKSARNTIKDRLETKAAQGVDSVSEMTGNYIEAQIYGKVTMADVDTIYVSSIKEAQALEKAIKKAGYDIKVAPCKYDERLKYLSETDSSEKYLRAKSSLTARDVDNLGDSYIDVWIEEFGTLHPGWISGKKGVLDDDMIDFVIRNTNAYKKASGKRDFETVQLLIKRGYAEMTPDNKVRIIKKIEPVTMEEKREFMKKFLKELSLKEKGRLDRYLWQHYRPTLGGFTDDVFNKELLKNYVK